MPLLQSEQRLRIFSRCRWHLTCVPRPGDGLSGLDPYTVGILASLVAVLALATALTLVVAYTMITGVSPMPSGTAARAQLLRLLPVDPGGDVFELGAGWGGLATALAHRYPARRVWGYELSPVPWLWATLWRRIAGPANLILLRRDFLHADLATAGLIVCYLCPAGMARLRGKLEAELRPGTVVLSHFFALPGWLPEQPVTRAHDAGRSPIYEYRFPTCAPRAVGEVDATERGRDQY